MVFFKIMVNERNQLIKKMGVAWVVIVVLIISQSYVYASIPCEANGEPGHQQQTGIDPMLSTMGTHNMPSELHHEMQQGFSMDCCDQECTCLNGTYSSATLTHFLGLTGLLPVTHASAFYLFSVQDAFLPSLRKPPILS